MSYTISREKYAAMYGPTTGDKVRLADTDLVLEIEKDYTSYGDEAKFGGGKTLRDGMGQASEITSAGGALDLVLTNAIVMDPVQRIVKADIGIKDGRIVGLGKAGNPDIMEGVTPGLTVGASTEALAAEGLIVTPGGLDTHIHFISPQQIETALYSGITTMIGGGTGPADGTNATTCTPGPWNLREMLRAADAYPMNLGFLGKGNCSSLPPLAEQIEAGAMGLKIHEDWGATPAVIDACLRVSDAYDVQTAIHTDTLNEAGCVEDTLDAIGGRTIHTYHTEGAGGGHAPDIIRAAGFENILPSSTNPTMPFTKNTLDEHLDMLMVCHHLDSRIPEDVAFADSRIRPETIAAEDVLHDMGIFSMMSSDSQAMGRVGEVIVRTWQTADKMKKERGRRRNWGENDNFRILRYLSKYTINPAITHGLSRQVGPLKRASWPISCFGILLSSACAQSSSSRVASSSLRRWGNRMPPSRRQSPYFTAQMFGAAAGARHDTCITFVSKAAYDANIKERLGLMKQVRPVSHCRDITKKDMHFNDKTPSITVNPETYEVRVDGAKITTSKPAERLPLAQLYHLF